jgi:hypothetical protein
LLATHAALPVAASLGGDLVRVFYSGRDIINRSSIGSLVLRLGESPRVEEVAPEPVLTPGVVGAFDDAGCGMGCVVPDPAGDRIYYMGWNLGRSVPWRNAIGLAIGDLRTGRFERYSAGPVMDRDTVDPFTLSYPWVLRFGPMDWRMWYGTSTAWSAEISEMHHVIREARSEDGIHWRRDPRLILEPEGEEIAVVRPCVLSAGEGAEMWFARRTDQPYQIGHASSADGSEWSRDEVALLHPGSHDFEAGAITYPCVFDAAGGRWLLYNGAGYGATGIGLAVWEE